MGAIGKEKLINEDGELETFKRDIDMRQSSYALDSCTIHG